MNKRSAFVMVSFLAVILMMSACSQELDYIDEEEQVIDDEYEVIEIDDKDENTDEEPVVETETDEKASDDTEEVTDETTELEEPEVTLEVEHINDKIVFTAVFHQEVIIPKYMMYYGNNPHPWQVHYRSGENNWEQLQVGGSCIEPSCDHPREEPIAVCDIVSPECKKSSDEEIYEWNKKYIVMRMNYNDWNYCFEKLDAQPGEYKVLFLYKTDPCPLTHYILGRYREEFKDNIKTVEKTFTIN